MEDLEVVLMLGMLIIAFMCGAHIIRGIVASRKKQDDTVEPPPRAYPPSLFEKLSDYGFTVCTEKEWCTLQRPPVFGYAVCYGVESVYHCRACNQRGKHPFGETTSIDGRQWCRVDWFGVVCRWCGHMERYVDKQDGGGFFGLVLENGDSLLDVIAALDAEGSRPLLEKMEHVLGDHEAASMAKVEAIVSLRKDLALVAIGAKLIPFRSSGRKTSFLS